MITGSDEIKFPNMFLPKDNRDALLGSYQKWFLPEPQTRFVYVFVCYFCGEEFSLRESLQKHQTCCNMIPPDGGLQKTSKEEVVPETAQCQTSVLYKTSLQPAQGCDVKPFSTPTLLESGLTACASPIRDQLKKSLTPLKTPGTPSSPYALNKVSKTKFLTGLGLVPIQKARRVSVRRRSTQCENIDLEDEAMPSPSKPRTPKLLISHLSRDESGTASENSKSCMRSLFTSQDSRIDEDVEESYLKKDVEERKGEKTDSTGTEKPQDRLRNVKSLFNIAISSPLGQFVMKHYKGDPSLHVLSDIESHCLTEVNKNQEGLRLRARHPVYPITFRGYLRAKDVYSFHRYNFNREHKKEFIRRVRTGLDRRGRALCRTMKKCEVYLTRLTKAELKLWMPSQNQLTVDLRHLTPQEIVYWTSPKQEIGTSQPAVFPSGLSLSSPNLNKVLGLRTREDKDNACSRLHRQLSVTNFVSEEVAAEVTENRRTVLNSVLFDLIGKGEISKDKLAVNSSKLPHQCGIGNYSTLRRLLSSSGDGRLSKVCTLPDITNLTPTARSKSFRISLDQRDLENNPSCKTESRDAVQSSSTNRKSGETTKPISPYPLSSAVKSTTVRLALEGERIFMHESLQTHSASIKSTEKVFLDNMDSKSIFFSSPSNSSAPNLDKTGSEASPASTSRTLRKRPSKLCTLDQHQSNSSKVPLSGYVNEERNKVSREKTTDMEKVTHCSDRALVKSSEGPHNLVIRSISDVESNRSSRSFALPKQNRVLYDSKFRKKLLSAGLIWRPPPSSFSQLGQENESNGRTVSKLVKSEANKNNLSSRVGSAGRKRGRPSKNKTGRKKSCVTSKSNVFKASVNGNLPIPERNGNNPAGNLVRSEWGKDVTSLSMPKQCLASQNRRLYNHVPTRDKPKRSVSSRGKNLKKIDGTGSKDIFTAIKARVNTAQSSTGTFNLAHSNRPQS